MNDAEPSLDRNSTVHLGRLMSYLAQDPENAQLLLDCSSVAINAGKIDIAAGLLAQFDKNGTQSPELLNLKAVLAMMKRNFGAAHTAFRELMATGANDPAIRFNFAWSKAMLEDYAGAEALLDDEVVNAVPRAAGLKIQMLHHLQRMDDGLACGAQYVALYPQDQALFGALSVLAMDADQAGLAEHYARGASNSAEGLSTLGSLLLGSGKVEESLGYFADALKLNPNSGRSWLGTGLVGLSQGNIAQAAIDLDRAAGLLKTHLGSWIASGWAHFINKDIKVARTRFETALALDSRFSESHGGLAVIDINEGYLKSARKRTERALRLDPACFSGALAKSMLLALDGDVDASTVIRDRTLTTPIYEDSITIVQATIQFGFTNKRKGN
jgi:tetratricopeptide (TPR) repeat protein